MGLVAPEERGKAAGITASFVRLPNGMSATVGLTLIGQGLLALPFYIAAVLYVVAIGFFWILFRNARVPEEVVKESQVSVQSSSFEGPVAER
jgi:predicted MFS family arabinose efflux permease